ncbi:MAG: hypothetical protein ETSY2_16420 [Candidatus Entotheonella gemina]|uniref:Formyl transferase N-terminal domain-containing protein n=1 Tax=Candidatus Entotheonella gemina TaxID=1429439 RepID=W4M9E8_9BACT|nr:MAG: hypothetical protein ETSY2_16420 [Candidatus Entotheonella gemina]
MKVIALCANFKVAIALWYQLHRLDHIDFTILISKASKKQGRIAFIWQLLKGFLGRLWPRDQCLAWQLWRAKKLHISLSALQDESTLAWIRQQAPDVGLHAIGVIYRKSILDCFRLGILNPHIGLLPEYRGRSVMEWSLLNGDPTGITTFFIDEGIDTGARLVLREAVDVSLFREIAAAKQFLFSLNGVMFAKALEVLQPSESAGLCHQKPEDGKRYYVMSSLFTEVARQMLPASATSETS